MTKGDEGLRIEQRHIDLANDYLSSAFRCTATLAERFAKFEADHLAGVGADAIADDVILDACETDPADPNDPETLMITLSDLREIIIGTLAARLIAKDSQG
jgi:hypothetical protein